MLSSTVIWITGLSGSGKSTLAFELIKKFRERKINVISLDGDELREIFGHRPNDPQSHGREARLELALQYARLCRMFSKQGFTVVIATISLFHEVHAWNRTNIDNYFEVYLKVPFSELRRRDPKGIYKRFDLSELNNVVGLDLPFDEPEEPDWVMQYESEDSWDSQVEKLISLLNDKGVM